MKEKGGGRSQLEYKLGRKFSSHLTSTRRRRRQRPLSLQASVAGFNSQHEEDMAEAANEYVCPLVSKKAAYGAIGGVYYTTPSPFLLEVNCVPLNIPNYIPIHFTIISALLLLLRRKKSRRRGV